MSHGIPKFTLQDPEGTVRARAAKLLLTKAKGDARAVELLVIWLIFLPKRAVMRQKSKLAMICVSLSVKD